MGAKRKEEENSVQTCSEAQTAYPMSTGVLSSEVKQPGREAEHSTSDRGQELWSYTFTATYKLCLRSKVLN
jgi:hypothetical protein